MAKHSMTKHSADRPARHKEAEKKHHDMTNHDMHGGDYAWWNQTLEHAGYHTDPTQTPTAHNPAVH